MNEHPNLIAVKRDGPRGWHWIARDSYDPAVHVLHVTGGSEPALVSADEAQASVAEAVAELSKPKPRSRKVAK